MMNIYAVVLAAGKGTRMKSSLPKVAHEVLYKPMISHITDVLKTIDVKETIVVVGHQAEVVKAILKDEVTFVMQEVQLGTGHAIKQAKDILADKEGITLVLNGDAPLITKKTIEELIETHMTQQNKTTIVSANCDVSKAFGRLVRDELGNVEKIVEFKDATDLQKAITEMNTGIYCFDNIELFKALDQVTNDNAQNEYYITDVVKIMNETGLKVGSYVIDDFDEVGGINDRNDLANATTKLRERINREHLLNGVTLIDPNTTYIARDVIIGEDTIIEPGCILKGNTVIGSHCHIGPYCEFDNVVVKDNVEIKFSVLSDSIIENGVDIGPYARLRKDCHILENVHMGNFVEMKNTTFGKGSKCAHLSYIGDATVGENVNIGCGTITSNYDGKNKFKTIIKDNVFVGCNSNLVAPVTIEDNAYIGAGSTITQNVNEEDFAIARARQVNKTGYAKVLKEKRERK
ncbi:MAG: bifunctional UDP-N-acetylglucosamine diphosphorylase/glucosamine-1-phosphate N-acetyltransferase GlmU [Erysipelotrichaceae bacterium]|nr:bifunctional UDP-N-acetylglucosamine diphosphorylase/glucosamine-1-phosphate N-acetyltransferase GlmU [Erysipelotrichaceae bacterium]